MGKNIRIANASIIGAICVVGIHVDAHIARGCIGWWVWQLLANGFCRWAVPFFFLASARGGIDFSDWV